MFNIVVLLMTLSHARAVFADPGIVPLPKTSLDFSDLHSDQKKATKVLSSDETELFSPILYPLLYTY